MSSRSQRLIRDLEILAGTTVLLGTLVALAWAALAVISGTGLDYGHEPATAADWMRAIDRSTRTVLQTASLLGTSLLVTCAFVAVAALRRRIGTFVLGATCSLLLGIALASLSATAQDLEDLTTRAVIAVGSAAAPEPPPPPPDLLTVGEARAEVLTMLAATLESAVEPVESEVGSPLIVDGSLLVSAPCGDVGAQVTASMAFRTGDNAASLRGILSVWDSAGYLPGRAIQEDLRFSTTQPIEQMSLRDTTTIDGLVHLTVRSACAVADG